MFSLFKKKAVDQVLDTERKERTASLNQRIKEKLEEIKSTNHVLNETVEHTQAANVKLALKLKKHLKSGNRSFASLSDKLNVGVIIVNHEGFIIQENPRARVFLGCDITCECFARNLYNQGLMAVIHRQDKANGAG